MFLTGHTGFKGSWLSILLKDWGSSLSGYALLPEDRSIFRAAGVDRLFEESTSADIRDLASLKDALNKSQPEVVFHLAAQSLVRPSYRAPVETYATNVMGTVHLLEACREISSIKAVVIVTSDKCYENNEWVWGYRETEPMGGFDPYSNSKGCAELVTAAYRSSFYSDGGAKIASGRAGNVIGGGDYSLDRLIPDVVRSIVNGTDILVRNPDAIRPWQHVLEPLSGYIRLAECLAGGDGHRYAEGWNFGPSSTGDRTVSDVVEAMCQHFGQGNWQHRKDDTQVHEAHYLKLDSSKALKHLSWKPRWNFDETIRQTVHWYLSEHNGDDMLAVTRQQIASYLAT